MFVYEMLRQRSCHALNAHLAQGAEAAMLATSG